MKKTFKILPRIALFGTIALVTVVALLISVLSFLDRREWAQTKAELLARGEKLSLAEFVPPPVPDGLNFFGDPIWKELEDTKPASSETGLEGRELKLPPDKLQIAQLDPRPSPEIRERAINLLNLKNPPEDQPRAAFSIATSAAQKLARETDPGRAAQIAQLILDTYAPADAFRRHIEALLDRPFAVSPIAQKSLIPADVHELNAILRIARTYGILASAHLALGQRTASLHDVETIARIGDTLRNGPLLLTYLVRLSVYSLAASRVDKGIAARQWTDSELAEIDRILARIDLRSAFTATIRGERAYGNSMFEIVQRDPAERKRYSEMTASLIENPVKRFWTQKTAGWGIAADQSQRNRTMQEFVDFVEGSDRLNPRSLPTLPSSFWFRFRHPFTDSVLYSIRQCLLRTVQAQDAIAMTRIACALERYRLRNGNFPAQLSDIVPSFLSVLPDDVIAGQAFQYKRSRNGFTLWSPGWNQKDEDALVGATRAHYEDADWVWNRLPGEKYNVP